MLFTVSMIMETLAVCKRMGRWIKGQLEAPCYVIKVSDFDKLYK